MLAVWTGTYRNRHGSRFAMFIGINQAIQVFEDLSDTLSQFIQDVPFCFCHSTLPLIVLQVGSHLRVP